MQKGKELALNWYFVIYFPVTIEDVYWFMKINWI